MKVKALLIAALFASLISQGLAQRVPIFPFQRETMGTPGGTVSLAAHSAANGFDNIDTYTYDGGGIAGLADVRATEGSLGYTDASGREASAGGNIYFTASEGQRGFAIKGINCESYADMRLGFGYKKPSKTANATFVVQWSSDGNTWTDIPLVNMPATDASGIWYYVNDLVLPAAADGVKTLSLRWVKSGTLSMRIDDVVLTGVGHVPDPPPSITIGYPPKRSEVDKDTETQALSGVSSNARNHITWKNMGTGASGSIPAADNWAISSVGLRSGTNVIVVSASNNASARFVMAQDWAHYYGATWSDGQNMGAGFGHWEITKGATAVATVERAKLAGTGINIDSNNLSFCLYGQSDYAEASRNFIEGPLAQGQAFAVNMGINWLDGGRGLYLFDANGTELFNFHAGDNKFYFAGVELPWPNLGTTGYSYYLTVDQIAAASTRVTLIRSDGLTNTQVYAWANPPARVKFYAGNVGDSTTEKQRRFYINYMRLLGLRAMDQVTVVRAPADPPGIVITDPAADVVTVDETQSSYPVAGTCTAPSGTRISWTNLLTGGSGSLASGATWTEAIPLGHSGTNVILVSVTNKTPDVYTMARDVAANYGGVWPDGVNHGAGFGAWRVEGKDANAAMVLASSIEGGANMDVDTDGVSWCLYGKAGAWVTVSRPFVLGALKTGQGFAMDLAFNYLDGLRGFDLLDNTGATLFYFNAGNVGGFSFNGTSLGWNNDGNGYDYLVSVDQLAAGSTKVTVSRSDGASHSETFAWAKPPAGVKLYSGNNAYEGGDPALMPQLRFFINNMRLIGDRVMDQTTIIRLRPGLPQVSITSPLNGATFLNAVTSTPVSGTCNTNALGQLTWTNYATGESGMVPAGTTWTIGGVNLLVGQNMIGVSVTNKDGQTASASVSVTRYPPPALVTVTMPTGVVTVVNQVEVYTVAGSATNTPNVSYETFPGAANGSASVRQGTWAVTNAPLVAGVNYILITATNSMGFGAAASDSGEDAGYSAGWTDGSTGGTGFGAWQLATGVDREYSTGTDAYGRRAWGMLSANARVAEAVRAFDAPVAVGDEVSVRLTPSTNCTSAGIVFVNSEGEPLLAFQQRDGAYWIRHNGGGDERAPLALSEAGLELAFSFRPDSRYTLVAEAQGGETVCVKGSLLAPSSGTREIRTLKVWHYLEALTGGGVFYVNDLKVSRYVSRDFAEVIRESADIPSVKITDPDVPVSYQENDVTDYLVRGECNAAVVGSLNWVVTPSGDSGTLLAALEWEQLMPLAEGTNVITVTGTNATGVARSASVTIVREGSGIYSNYPSLDITYPPPGTEVNFMTEMLTVTGACNDKAVGNVSLWSVTDDGFYEVPAAAEWEAVDATLAIGENWFVAWVDNSGPVEWAEDSAAAVGYHLGSWTNDSNEGEGMKGWAISTEGTASNRVSNLAAFEHTPGWNLYAATGTVARATRQFSTYLREGDQFDAVLAHSDMAEGGKGGMALINNAGLKMVEFYYDADAQDYMIADGEGVWSAGYGAAPDTALEVLWAIMDKTNYLLFVWAGEDTVHFRAGQMKNPLYGQYLASGYEIWNSGGGADSYVGMKNVLVTGGRAYAYTRVTRDARPPRPVWINELHYANDGPDVNEGIEVAGSSVEPLAGYWLVLYGPDGVAGDALELSGTIPSEQGSGYGALWFAYESLPNEPGNAVALWYEPLDQVANFVSWDGICEAQDGPASNMTSELIGNERSGTPVDYALQLAGLGTTYSSFTWGGPRLHSRGYLNAGQFVSTSTNAPGIPDTWWNTYFPGSSGETPESDADGDGVPNKDEFYADTDPTDPASFPAISDVQQTGSGVTITIPAVIGRFYSLYGSLSLLPPNWSLIWSGQATVTPLEVPIANPTNQAFYRYDVTLPGW